MDLYDVDFLFDNQLIACLERIINESDQKLFLVSPFINLDNRIKDALKGKIKKHDLEIKILFGKSKGNYQQSVKSESLLFLKSFPNIEIRHNERLHAKFYLNDCYYLITSLNLYDFSLANNIEVGLLCNYASKGLMGKLFDSADVSITKGKEKLKENFLGKTNHDVNPVEKFETIFNNSERLYKTTPIISNESGVKGMLGGKQLTGFNVIEDKLTERVHKETERSSQKIGFNQTKVLSVTKMSKKFNIPAERITIFLNLEGYIDGEEITAFGKSKGLRMKKYMGNDYVAVPEGLINKEDIR